ncbi:MAG: hypothetical protein OXM61_13525 [Candidatus Poribacteria bacterium]|nr:hypothetical protein [Candidatus Poribacteria bacterium]
MKTQPNSYNFSSEDETEALSENPIIHGLLSEFLHAELQSLKRQINFSENLIALIETELSSANDAQLFRADTYRVMEELIPENVSKLLEASIEGGGNYVSLLEKTHDNFNRI